tara:strand:- start:16 stop:576 length:561 start_codon:yes stop_codon:yes gene_type:complete
MRNFSNHFLVSMPQISDPIFRETIIYICSHDDNGSMGLIINKSISELDLKQETSEILKQTKLYTMKPTPNVYFGGPVDLNMGIILHPLDYSTKKTIKISNKIGVTSDSKILSDIIKGLGPSMFRFSIGYTGWDKGQLEQEFENGDWLVVPSKSEIIFDMPDEQKWQYINNKLGIEISDLTGMSGFA